jgi:hypothetical protein
LLERIMQKGLVWTRSRTHSVPAKFLKTSTLAPCGSASLDGSTVATVE